MDNRKESGDKLIYEKPKLRIIPLVADEVLGLKCKQTPGSSGMGTGCGHTSCRGAGGS